MRNTVAKAKVRRRRSKTFPEGKGGSVADSDHIVEQKSAKKGRVLRPFPLDSINPTTPTIGYFLAGVWHSGKKVLATIFDI